MKLLSHTCGKLIPMALGVLLPLLIIHAVSYAEATPPKISCHQGTQSDMEPFVGNISQCEDGFQMCWKREDHSSNTTTRGCGCLVETHLMAYPADYNSSQTVIHPWGVADSCCNYDGCNGDGSKWISGFNNSISCHQGEQEVSEEVRGKPMPCIMEARSCTLRYSQVNKRVTRGCSVKACAEGVGTAFMSCTQTGTQGFHVVDCCCDVDSGCNKWFFGKVASATQAEASSENSTASLAKQPSESAFNYNDTQPADRDGDLQHSLIP
jgi:hypothetical protein